MAASSNALPWMIVDTSGSSAIPPARTYASLVSHKEMLYLFGGYGDTKGRFNDVYEYHPARGWRLVPGTGDLPKPVYLHSAVQYGHQMIVFGGNSGKETNDLHYYDLDSFHWIKTPASGLFGMNTSAMPAPRYGHSSCVYGANAAGGARLLIVGGCKSNNTYFKDSWSMDLASKKWSRLEDLPLDLAYHSLFTWQDRAYLFGGYNGKAFVQHMYLLDTTTGKWNILATSGQSPPPICGSATVLQGNELFVFAGYTAQGHTNELYRLNLTTRVWSAIPTTNKPLARAYLQAAIIGSKVFVIGGYDGQHCISDFRSITIPSLAANNNNPLLSALPPPPAPPMLSQQQQQQAPYPVSMSSPGNPFNNPNLGGNFGSIPPPNNNGNPFNQNSNNNLPPNPFNDQFFSLAPQTVTDTVLQNFANYNDYMSRAQLITMFSQLQQAWKARSSSALGPLPPISAFSSSSSSNSQYPFDTSKLSLLEALGFTKEHVLKVMGKMHLAGQNTKNVDLVADMCLREPQGGDEEEGGGGGAHGGNPALERSKSSERAELKKKVQQLMESQEEARTCKVCFDLPINCALQDCGHLAVCSVCAESLKTKGATCPICTKPFRSYLKIYWS